MVRAVIVRSVSSRLARSAIVRSAISRPVIVRSAIARYFAILLVIFLALSAGVPAAAQTADLAALKAEATGLARDSANIDTALAQQTAENARLRDQLNAVSTISGASVAALRQAQFEVDIVSTRLFTLDYRIAERTSLLDTLNGVIVQTSAALTSGELDTLQNVVDEAALDLRETIRNASAEFVAKLSAYREQSIDYLNLRQEQLAILQRSISLDTLEGQAPSANNPVVGRLRALVNDLAQQALALANEASAIEDVSGTAIERRNLLRLRSDEALLRSNARLSDVAIVEARARLDGLQPVLTEPAIPIRLFDDALIAVAEIDRTLNERTGTVGAIRDSLSDFDRLLADRADEATAAALRLRIAGLAQLFATQRSEIDTLHQIAATTRDALQRERAIRERATLFVRETARTDRAARERVATELRAIPLALGSLYQSRLTEVRTAVAVANERQLAGFGIAVLALFAVIAYLRRRVLKRFVVSGTTRATEVPLEVVRRNLYWLFPLATWSLFTQIFAIGRDTALTITTLLVIPAAAASLRDLTQVIVSRRAAGSRQQIGRIITRATEIAVVISAVFVFGYVVLDEMPLLPSTQSALNRLAYLVFVFSGLPMLLFVFYFSAPREDGREARIRRAAAGALSLLPPSALIATGITGLAGYTRLAAVMLQNLAITIAILALFALLLAMLNDVIEAVATRVRAHDPARAFFVRANFLQPLKRMGQALLAVVALGVATRVFGWTTDTPGVSQLVIAWNATVFRIGGTGYSVGAVLTSAAGFVFVFWLAAWSRRVAYTVVFGGLKDVGIRQSLSVFAQYVVIVIGVLLTLSAVGFDVTTLTVFAASLGVGIGFGLQNVVNNFISGLLLLVERPLRIGDIVTVGANSGTVSQIGIRSMRMKTFDEFDLIVPNSALISDTFTNWTRTNSVMRVVLFVTVAYDTAPDAAIAICQGVIVAHPGVLSHPAPQITAEDFTDSGMKLRLCYYIDLRGRYDGTDVRSEVLTQIWQKFSEEGVAVAFPQRLVELVVSGPDGGPDGTAAPGRSGRAGAWVGEAIERAQAGAARGGERG